MSDVQAGRYTGILTLSDQPETPVADRVVNVYVVGTTTPVAIYTDGISGIAAANPVVTDALGNFSFFAAPGDVDLVWQWGDVLIRETDWVHNPVGPLALTNPSVVSGTALQNTSAQDETWEIPLTSTGTGTYRIQKGPTSSVASTDSAVLALANTVTGLISTIVPAGWFCKITVANATIGTVACFNR